MTRFPLIVAPFVRTGAPAEREPDRQRRPDLLDLSDHRCR